MQSSPDISTGLYHGQVSAIGVAQLVGANPRRQFAYPGYHQG